MGEAVGAKRGSGPVPASVHGVPLTTEGGQVGADGTGRNVQSARQIGDGGSSGGGLRFSEEAQKAMAAQGDLALPPGQGCIRLACVHSPDDNDGLARGGAAVSGRVGVGQADAQATWWRLASNGLNNGPVDNGPRPNPSGGMNWKRR